MNSWEYCLVTNVKGKAEINYLTEEGDGFSSHEVTKRGTHNMAVALARLGREGWEMISIEGHMTAHTYGNAVLKRPLVSSE